MTDALSIRVDHVSKRYKHAAQDSVSNISLRIFQSDIFGLLGPNGAGKTTLISILCRVFSATTGEVTYYKSGEVITGRQINQSIGFVPQEYAFYPELTPLQNLAYFGALYNLKKEYIQQKSIEILSILGLTNVAGQKVATFSGGMKRRVNLAIGIIHRPDILFLDEPTVGVDVQSKNAIIRFLKELNQQGMTIVYTSHHLTEAQELCNRIALIDHGKVVAEDHLEKLLQTHSQPDLQALFLHLTGESYRD